MKTRLLLILAAAVLLLQGSCVQRPASEAGRDNFVHITDVVPDVILEIRYFGTYNFVGDRIDGYLAPTALLTREAADSLRSVSDDVITMGYRLKIYDAYRPQRGVDHFVRWAGPSTGSVSKAILISAGTPKLENTMPRQLPHLPAA